MLATKLLQLLPAASNQLLHLFVYLAALLREGDVKHCRPCLDHDLPQQCLAPVAPSRHGTGGDRVQRDHGNRHRQHIQHLPQRRRPQQQHP